MGVEGIGRITRQGIVETRSKTTHTAPDIRFSFHTAIDIQFSLATLLRGCGSCLSADPVEWKPFLPADDALIATT